MCLGNISALKGGFLLADMQERILAETGTQHESSWRKNYFLPAQADRHALPPFSAVHALRSINLSMGSAVDACLTWRCAHAHVYKECRGAAVSAAVLLGGRAQAVHKLLQAASSRPQGSLILIALLAHRLVAAFRKWLDMRGGGGPPTKLPSQLPPLVDRQEVFLNRYEQHTKHCPYCSGVSALVP